MIRGTSWWPAQCVAARSVKARPAWVARRVAGRREFRFMHRKLLISKGFRAAPPQYDIVLM